MKTNKVLSILLFLVILVSSFTFPVMAQDNIKVLLNGTELTFDVPPQLINGRTMVPMRKIFEALGADVDWTGATQTIVATKDDTVIIMQIDNNVISVDGKEITLDVPPQLIDGRTLVPVRAVAEGLSAKVNWDKAAQTVTITKEEKPESIETVSLIYMDPEIKMFVLLNNPDWVYYKDKDKGIVYFFNNVNKSAKNLISMSSREFSGDADKEMKRVGKTTMEGYAGLFGDIKFKDAQAIKVGIGNSAGYLYPFEAKDGGVNTVWNIMYWSTGNTIYTCISSADVQGSKEVQDVLNGILESFLAM